MSLEGQPWLTAARDDWLSAVSMWVGDALASRDAIALEPIKERPWGAVLRVVTPTERLVFKAMGPRGRHETLLLVDVAACGPKLAPEVLAADHDRGWVLMRDHGVPIDVASVPEQVGLVERLLPAYAEMQMASADRVAGWIEAGVPDRSPRELPALLDELLANRGRSAPLPVDARELETMRTALGSFDRVCETLARSGIEAIDHSDIHGTNVLVDADGPRLVDWGDACVGHPFTSLLVPIEWIAGRLPAADVPAGVSRLYDAYVEPWGDAADPELVGLAMWLGYAARALSNDEQCPGGSPADVADAQREIVALLRVWKAKSTQLGEPRTLLLPAMPWREG